MCHNHSFTDPHGHEHHSRKEAIYEKLRKEEFESAVRGLHNAAIRPTHIRDMLFSLQVLNVDAKDLCNLMQAFERHAEGLSDPTQYLNYPTMEREDGG